MAEYIDREAATNVACNILWNLWKMNDLSTSVMAKALNSIPAADVAPVVHGRWTHLGGDEWCCSACGFVITTEGSWYKPTKKYCEDCGAKIDGGIENAVG